MTKISMIVNPEIDSAYTQNHIRKEFERSGQFSMTIMSEDVDAVLKTALDTDSEVLLLEPSLSERQFAKQIEAIVDFRKTCGKPVPSNIILITPKVSEYAVRRLSDADMLFHFMRPCEPHVLVEKLVRIFGADCMLPDGPEREECRAGLEKLLFELDIYPYYVGFNYLIDAVALLQYQRSGNGVTKSVYPEIAKRYGKSSGSVERAIRFLIPVAYGSGSWRKLFPEYAKQPTNSEFLHALVRRVRSAEVDRSA